MTTDFSEGLVKIMKERAAAKNCKHVTCEVMDARVNMLPSIVQISLNGTFHFVELRCCTLSKNSERIDQRQQALFKGF